MIAFICYLEIVLWTSCICAASLPGADHSYLARETGNLKLAGRHAACVKFVLPDRPIFEYSLRQEQESIISLQEQETVSPLLPRQLSASLLGSLRLYEGLLSGIPAPFTGIEVFL